MAAQAAGPASPGPRGGGSVTLSLTAIAVAAVAAIMAAAALGLGQAGRAPVPAASAPVVRNGQSRLFNVELGDMFVRPSSVSVPYGSKGVLHVVNRGAMGHDLQLEGGATGTGMLAPGQARTVSYGVFGRTGQARCTAPGHTAAGMILTVTVTGTAASVSAARDAVISPAATPPPGWHASGPGLAPAPSGTVHRVPRSFGDL